MLGFTRITSENVGGFVSQIAYIHYIAYVIRGCNARKAWRLLCHVCHVVSARADSKGNAIPCDESVSVDCADSSFSHAEIIRAETAWKEKHAESRDMSLLAYDVYVPVDMETKFLQHVYDDACIDKLAGFAGQRKTIVRNGMDIDVRKTPIAYVHFCGNAKIPHGMGKLAAGSAATIKLTPKLHITGKPFPTDTDTNVQLGRRMTKPKPKTVSTKSLGDVIVSETETETGKLTKRVRLTRRAAKPTKPDNRPLPKIPDCIYCNLPLTKCHCSALHDRRYYRHSGGTGI